MGRELQCAIKPISLFSLQFLVSSWGMYFTSYALLLKVLCTSPWMVRPEQPQMKLLFCERKKKKNPKPSANWKLLSFTVQLCEFFQCVVTALLLPWKQPGSCLTGQCIVCSGMCLRRNQRVWCFCSDAFNIVDMEICWQVSSMLLRCSMAPRAIGILIGRMLN